MLTDSSWSHWAWFGLAAGLLLFLRYVIIVGFSEWMLSRSRAAPRFAERRIKLSPKPRRDNQTREEIKLAAATSLIFGFSTALLLWAYQAGQLKIYLDLQAYPLWWLPLSLLLAMLIHETYYYWLHRLMHLPQFYSWLHRGHHDSIVTSGWTSFAFDPGEAVLQAAVIPVILLFLPMHAAVLVLWLLIMTFSALINHLGVEFYPKGSYRHWLGKQFIGATHHGLHHTRFTRNFGLYFTFWDRWMGTEASETLAEFDKVTQPHKDSLN